MSDKFLLFFDLDGTLIEEDEYVDQRIIEMLYELKEKGHRCFAATGRGYITIPKCLQEALDGFVTLTGASIVFHDSVDIKCDKKSKLLVEFAGKCNALGLPVFTESDNQLNYIETELYKENDLWMQRARSCCHNIFSSFEDYRANASDEVGKLDLRASLYYKFKELLDEYKEQLIGLDSGADWFEVLSNEVSKGNGIKKIIDYYQKDYQKTIAVGDSENDLSMFEICSIKIAVSNASNLLKQKATIVLTGNTYEGLKNYFEEIGVL